MDSISISAIILSAGESQRMGMPKALCLWKGNTFLESVVSCLRKADITRIGVVLGAWESEIKAHGLPDGVEVWYNPNYHHGQLSSLQVGLKHQKSDILGTIVALVDHPAVTPETVRTIIRKFNNKLEKVVKPTYQGAGGHPILIGRDWWNEIISPLESQEEKKGRDDDFPPTIVRMDAYGAGGNKRGVNSLRHIFKMHPDQIITVEVKDPGILLDIDTPEALSRYSL
jgi:molybdenum cofactor cytidylyltransferase